MNNLSRTLQTALGPSRTLRTEQPSSSWLDRFLRRGSSSNNTASQELEDIIDVENNLELFSNRQLNNLNPTILYRTNRLFSSNSIYRHQRTEALHLPSGREERLTLISPTSVNQLLQRQHNYIHLGMIVIGIRGLTRKQNGGKVFLILYDDRFPNPKQAIIGLIECDMNNNMGIVYISPNFSMLIKDFSKYIKILVKTQGYDNFSGNNIQLDIVFMGRTSNNMNHKYKVNINNIVDSLSSHGVSFLQPQSMNPTFENTEWTFSLRPPSEINVPTQHHLFIEPDNTIHVRFSEYTRETVSDDETESIKSELEAPRHSEHYSRDKNERSFR